MGCILLNSVKQCQRGASTELRLAPGVARLNLGAGDEDDLLIAGTVMSDRGERIEQEFEHSGSLASYAIASRRSGMPVFGDDSRREWDLEVNPDIPLDLMVDAGVGRIELDLSELQISDLSLNLGVGDSLVILPETGDFEASIEAGVGEVTVRIPRELAARISADRGIGSVNVSGDYRRDGELFVSPDFDEAEDRVVPRVNGGVGSIDIETF